MILRLAICLLLTGCFQGRHLQTVTSLSSGNLDKTVRLLDSDHRYLRLSTLQHLNQQAWRNPPTSGDATVQSVLARLEDNNEWCPIRGQAALLIGQWQLVEHTEAIIHALEACDDESRFWMLKGLEHLGEQSSLAKGTIQVLSNDPDIFIRTEATAWLEAQ